MLPFYQAALIVSQNIGCTYKTQPNNVNLFFLIIRQIKHVTNKVQLYQKMKISPPKMSSQNNGPTFPFRDTGHQTSILANVEDFHAVHVGFQHSMFY